MAPSSTVSPSLPPYRSHLFTPIQEGNESEETEERRRFDPGTTPGSTTDGSFPHKPTPLHPDASSRSSRSSAGGRRSRRPDNLSSAVSCSNCRPSSREKPSVAVVVPLDNHHHGGGGGGRHSLSMASPNNLLKSLLSGISRRSSPKPPEPSTSSSTGCDSHNNNQWRITAAELSHKLVLSNRRRDEAVLEASRLKYSMAELESKLSRLETYCHGLKSGLEACGLNSRALSPSPARLDSPVIKDFLSSASQARSSVRSLSRALTSQLKLMGLKVFDRLNAVLRPYDIKLSASSNNPRTLQVYLEALLSAAFFEDFETAGFSKNSTNRVLNPIDRSESNYSDFSSLRGLSWEEVLSKGTKHFSEDFSKFCDRKMSEIVAMLGWTRAWPEQLLQAFFGASKSVWLVHLLANSVHPALTIFRVEKGARFDSVYMEDMGGDKASKKLVPGLVRIMVEPGFYVYDNVVKCKVVCRYYNGSASTYGVFSATSNLGDNRSAISTP